MELLSYLPHNVLVKPLQGKQRKTSSLDGQTYEKLQKPLWNAVVYIVERIHCDIHFVCIYVDKNSLQRDYPQNAKPSLNMSLVCMDARTITEISIFKKHGKKRSLAKAVHRLETEYLCGIQSIRPILKSSKNRIF